MLHWEKIPNKLNKNSVKYFFKAILDCTQRNALTNLSIIVFKIFFWSAVYIKKTTVTYLMNSLHYLISDSYYVTMITCF